MSQKELEILGSLSLYSHDELYRSVNTLFERGIIQKRGNWRAILQQTIANKLAVTALNSIHQRLLMSLVTVYSLFAPILKIMWYLRCH